MSKRITLILTDDEYAFLEQRAQQERRTVREMAAYLVTRPAYHADWTYRYLTPYVAPQSPFLPPFTVTSSGTTGVTCYACSVPGANGTHICGLGASMVTN